MGTFWEHLYNDNICLDFLKVDYDSRNIDNIFNVQLKWNSSIMLKIEQQ